MSVLRLLDADPALGDGLAPEEREAARAALLADVHELPPGPWAGEPPPGEPPPLGWLVLDGLLVRAAGPALAPAGPGDLLRPWEEHGTRWWALGRVALAALEGAFARRAARWPAVQAALLARAGWAARWLAVSAELQATPRVDERLALLCRALASRWGAPDEHGIRLPGPLGHETLAGLVGARLAATTAALRALERRGALRIAPGGALVLTPG